MSGASTQRILLHTLCIFLCDIPLQPYWCFSTVVTHLRQLEMLFFHEANGGLSRVYEEIYQEMLTSEMGEPLMCRHGCDGRSAGGVCCDIHLSCALTITNPWIHTDMEIIMYIVWFNFPDNLRKQKAKAALVRVIQTRCVLCTWTTSAVIMNASLGQ